MDPVTKPEKIRTRRRVVPKHAFINRELSWMAFNERVLEEALDTHNPLLERLRFLTIFHTNLDEFFMIRVSGLQEQIAAGVGARSFDGLTPRTQLGRISSQLRPVLSAAARCLAGDILPKLEHHGIQLIHWSDLDKREKLRWSKWYQTHVHPVLTPLAVGPAQPFPWISNLSLNLALQVRAPDGEQRFARIKVPPTLPRLVSIDEDEDDESPIHYLPIEELIGANLESLFPGMETSAPWAFRVTRDTDVEIKADEAGDLLKSVEQEIRKRRFGEAVRLEVQSGIPTSLRETLRKSLDLDPGDVYDVDGLLSVPHLSQLLQLDLPELKYPPFKANVVATGDLFKAMRHGDILLHHPFDSFAPVVDFLQQAARDPNVQAIKITLYRTSGDSAIIQALEEAIERGKQVAAVVELKARFDEENNITWARRLEEAGVHVVYGVPNLKVHCKLAMVVRTEGEELRRYAHIGTGNYNTNTARVYTDFGLLTANPALCADVADIFNTLTGFAQPPHNKNGLLVAPRHLKDQLIERIRREAHEAEAGRPSRIIAKCNAIADMEVIKELYQASRAGVPIDLLVRGICCLIPGQKDLSETIRVRSVVGRFLEHSRVYWFQNGDLPEMFIGSADLMDRNLKRRVEVLAPITDPDLQEWLKSVYLDRYLNDTARTREMASDGTYHRIVPATADAKDRGRDVHHEFLRDRR